jgi:hypothetical protein
MANFINLCLLGFVFTLCVGSNFNSTNKSTVIVNPKIANQDQYTGSKIKCLKKVKTKGFSCTIKGKRVKYYWQAIYIPYCDTPGTFNGGATFDTCDCDCYD